jgi:hypothetical protein
MAKKPKCPIAGMVCPRNNDPEAGSYCPAWVEYTQTNLHTQEERTAKECLFQALPVFLVETLRAANRPAAAVESTRNEIARGFAEISHHMQRIPATLLEDKS